MIVQKRSITLYDLYECVEKRWSEIQKKNGDDQAQSVT